MGVESRSSCVRVCVCVCAYLSVWVSLSLYIIYICVCVRACESVNVREKRVCAHALAYGGGQHGRGVQVLLLNEKYVGACVSARA